MPEFLEAVSAALLGAAEEAPVVAVEEGAAAGELVLEQAALPMA